jgi:putative membrane protein
MMLPPSWSIAGLVAGNARWLHVGVSALAFTAWDLFLDPQMVGWRLWVWEQKGRYFGIPLLNYLGWALISAVMTAAIRPGALPASPLQLIYALTWLLETFGLGVFWRQPGPAACGFLGMGSILFWAWLLST